LKARLLDYRPGPRAWIDPWLLKIKGNPERLAFMLHRLTGVIVSFFLFAHILTVSRPAREGGWEAYLEEALRLGEPNLTSILFYIAMGAILFHGINGIRLIIVEALALGIGRPEKPKPPYIAPSLRGFQRALIYLTFIVWAVLWLLLGYYMFMR